MQTTPLISVVIAAYNVEKYIEECLNSILNQTFQDWECIIVNDASTDHTLSIIEAFAAKDKRFRYDSLPVNSGSAKAPRDKAVSYAKAEWILQVDSDDFIDNNVLERLYARAMQTDADIVFLRLDLFDGETFQHISFCPEKDFDMQRTLTGDEAVMLTIPDWIIAGNGLIRKKLWDMRSTVNKGIHYLNIDEFDGREWFFNANYIVFEDVIYHYRQYSSSITNKVSSKQFEHVITDKMIEKLIHDRFGKESRQALIVSQWRMNNMIDYYKFYRDCRSIFSYSEQNESKKLLKEHFMTIDKRFIPRNGIKRWIFRSFILFEFYIFCCTSGKMRFFRRIKNKLFKRKK